MIVQMHFGDGSFKDIETVSDDPETAVKEAKDWVLSNAWFEATDPVSCEMLATENI